MISRHEWKLSLQFVLVCIGISQIGHALAAPETVTYVYSDLQGTVLAEADEIGNVTAQFDYRGFGRSVLGGSPNGPGYAGHVNEADTGLVYMQARYYDPDIGRFLSPDPVWADDATGANFNRYWYANNNPVKFIDPDGRCTGSRIVKAGGLCRSSGSFTTVAITASNGASGSKPVELPSSVKIEGSGFTSEGDAAKAAGQKYGSEGVQRQRELQLGLTQLDSKNWGYLTPGWGPEGATIVDPKNLFLAYIAAGYSVSAWMHGHFDNQLNFSAADFAQVWVTRSSAYLVNSASEVRVLTDGYLRRALKDLPMDQRRKGLQGLQGAYYTPGLPGEKL